jgi:hypothetical protein
MSTAYEPRLRRNPLPSILFIRQLQEAFFVENQAIDDI